MPQKITTGFRALVDAAEREIETLSVEDAIALHGRDDVTFSTCATSASLSAKAGCPAPFTARAACSNSGSIRKAPITSRSSPRTKVRVLLRRRLALGARRETAQRMGLRRSRISRADSAPGARPAGRSNRRRKSKIVRWFSKIRRKQARTCRSVSTTCACRAGKSGTVGGARQQGRARRRSRSSDRTRLAGTAAEFE